MIIEVAVHRSGTESAIECLTPLNSPRQATDLISLCVEHETNRLLIDAICLPEDFFQLQTLFAGEFMQKLQDYQLRTAVVISPQRPCSERFREYMLEARHARYSRIFTDRDEALRWLLQESRG